MSWTKIERHTMVKHDYSPLDKSKSDYFFKRRYYQRRIFSDKGLFELDILKGTCQVLGSVRTRNRPILSNIYYSNTYCFYRF